MSGAPVVVLCALLTLTVAGGALSHWGGARVATLTGGFLQATPTPTPLTLSKEYVYSGGRLVATEEPAPTAVLAGPTNLVVTADARSSLSQQPSVSLTWTAPAAGTVDHYVVERAESASGPFTPLAQNPAGTSCTDSPQNQGVVSYLYRVKAVFSGGAFSDYSNKDLATTAAYEDQTLTPRVTVIRARQLIELRQTVAAVRTLAGLSAPAWTYPDPVSDPAQRRLIYLEDVADLRANLDEALNVLGLYQPYPQSPTLARGTTVYAEHFLQIRARVQ